MHHDTRREIELVVFDRVDAFVPVKGQVAVIVIMVIVTACAGWRGGRIIQLKEIRTLIYITGIIFFVGVAIKNTTFLIEEIIEVIIGIDRIAYCTQSRIVVEISQYIYIGGCLHSADYPPGSW